MKNGHPAIPLNGHAQTPPATETPCTCRAAPGSPAWQHDTYCPQAPSLQPATTPTPPPAPRKAPRKPRATKAREAGSQGAWRGICDHSGHEVPIPGVAREDGHKARVLAAQKLSAELGVEVRAEYVRVRWIEADERKGRRP